MEARRGLGWQWFKEDSGQESRGVFMAHLTGPSRKEHDVYSAQEP